MIILHHQQIALLLSKTKIYRFNSNIKYYFRVREIDNKSVCSRQAKIIIFIIVIFITVAVAITIGVVVGVTKSQRSISETTKINNQTSCKYFFLFYDSYI